MTEDLKQIISYSFFVLTGLSTKWIKFSSQWTLISDTVTDNSNGREKQKHFHK